MNRIKLWHWVSLVILAFCLAFLGSVVITSCSSEGAQKVASTTEVGVSTGRFEGDGDMLSGDASSVWVSVRPLAALEPAQEVRVISAPPVAPEPVEELTEPVEEPEVAEEHEDGGVWWRNESFLGWMKDILLLVLGAGGLLGGQEIARRRSKKVANEDAT